MSLRAVIKDHRPLCDVVVSNAQRSNVPNVVEFMEGVSQYVSVNIKLHQVPENYGLASSGLLPGPEMGGGVFTFPPLYSLPLAAISELESGKNHEKRNSDGIHPEKMTVSKASDLQPLSV
jgi:hypothetical protein